MSITSGLGGNECIFDIGGDPYLLPTPTFDKIYDLRSIINLTNDQKTFVMGAGAGPWPLVKTNCEVRDSSTVDT